MNSALPVAVLLVGGVDLSVDVEPLHVVPEGETRSFAYHIKSEQAEKSESLIVFCYRP